MAKMDAPTTDISGKLSEKSDRKEYIIVQIDALTKYVYVFHTFSLDTNTCINAMKSSIAIFGVPTHLIADQGRSFTRTKLVQFCFSQKIQLHLVCGEDNKYATLMFIINNARIGYIKMYSVSSERQTDCECVKSLAPRSSYRHIQAYKVVAE